MNLQKCFESLRAGDKIVMSALAGGSSYLVMNKTKSIHQSGLTAIVDAIDDCGARCEYHFDMQGIYYEKIVKAER